MNSSLLLKPWQYLFSAALTLLVWGLLSSPSHAGTCKSRTVKTESAPARSYEVDATPIEEVITSHKASVVWTGCETSDYGLGEQAGSWISFFPLSFNAYHHPLLTKVDLVNDSVNTSYHSSAYIRHGYYISCSVNGAKGFCLDKDEKNIDPPTKWPIDYGLRIYVETRWSATDKDGRGCMLFGTRRPGGGWFNLPDAGLGTEQVIRLRLCTDVRLDLTLSIVKTKPFVVKNFDVATVRVTTGTDKFRYRYCEYYVYCKPDNFLGGNFEVFNSGQPLTINLTKTVRPPPPPPAPTKKCVVQLQSAPTKSRL